MQRKANCTHVYNSQKKLRTELELAHLEYGQRFYDVLGSNGCEKIDDVLGLDGDTLRTVLDEIKALGRA